MSKKKFDEQELQQLKNNPYTYNVTQHTLSFTKEFKEIFYKEYSEGEIPRMILEKYGYPTEVLGNQRIWGITQCIKKEYLSDEGFKEGFRQKTSVSSESSGQDVEHTVRQLRHEVDYLKQEVEFLKKISSLRNIRK